MAICLFTYIYEKQNKLDVLEITVPEHFGMSHTAMDVGVHRGSHIARLSSYWTFIASIHDPIVMSSLLNILKLKARGKTWQTKQIRKDKILKETRIYQVCSIT